MRFKLLALALSSPLAFAAIADTVTDSFTHGKVSGEMAAGTLSGKTKERVYHPVSADKVSQLNWKYSNAAIVKGALYWDFIPWLSLGASAWTTIASRGGYMDDTDWLDESSRRWTAQSKHPATRLNYANEFDLNIKQWLLNEPDYRLGVMGGYQENRYSFKSNGGFYNYPGEDSSIREIGAFPAGTTVIGYRQRFKIPYMGLTGRYRYERFEFGGTFKFSGWVSASDNDEHYLTNTTFKANTANQKFYSLAADAGYYVTPKAKIYLDSIWSRTTNKKGNMSVNNHTDGTEETFANVSGIENNNYMISVGLKYAF
ncbi:omptin family outer membrane protease [Erwinia amylovora]|uniref:Outer membrane protease n=3 Tax=Erwinia amylovora TaxID=552 RepID=A0A831ENR1_ERWAM|nr:omptin family outer membrane protease [Erwinia amylovora]CDK13866.1 outer membrane protease precursor [Erwinia amylovora LA635]CDK17233.1 outer membrane protease precursor [Erwinia amylovora LA636]CDK20602.1 outer membrane protease precursor [Erwinia amylovora LA637]EKV55565.1 outer membrane protease precursor [Erwinia amylovora ACW56400]MBZ2390932.1 omptin family outer membrane protease [Erwinia amylovora]